MTSGILPLFLEYHSVIPSIHAGQKTNERRKPGGEITLRGFDVSVRRFQNKGDVIPKVAPLDQVLLLQKSCALNTWLEKNSAERNSFGVNSYS